ncbi:MAG: fibronectin type III domain-containing protein, partial [Halanaerobiales bacterium]|nr:fibronectin type III domain-containing protein [Halanaerobiales bacterium]
MLKKYRVFLAVLIVLLAGMLPVAADGTNLQSELPIQISDHKLQVTPDSGEVAVILENNSTKLVIGRIRAQGDNWITPSWYRGGYHGISGKKQERIIFTIDWDSFTQGQTKTASFELELKTIDFPSREQTETITITATKTGEAAGPDQPYLIGVEKTGEGSATIWFKPAGFTSRFARVHYQVNSQRRYNRMMRYQAEPGRWEFEIRDLADGDIIDYYIRYEKKWRYRETARAQYIYWQGPVQAPLLTAAVAADSEVSLSWDRVSAAEGYQVLYGTASGVYPEKIDVGNQTNYQVSGLLNNTTYYFAVKALRGREESGLSNEKSATPIPAKLSVRSGQTTDILNPAGYLIDGDLNTSWGFKPGSTEGWAELDLGRKTLLYGLEVAGTLYPETIITLEYMKEGLWRPFMAPQVTELGTKQVIDLSYDQIVSAKLRLRLTGSGVENSSIAEIKVLGAGINQFDQKIKAEKISASGNTAPTAPAEFLVDQNTYTLWQTKPSFRSRSQLQGLDQLYTAIDQEREEDEETEREKRKNREKDTAGEVIFTFADHYQLAKIKIFFTEKARGSFSLVVENNGNWQQLADIPDGTPQGWYQLDISSQEISTAKVRLAVKGSNGQLGGVSEVEFYGRGRYQGAEYKLLGIPETVKLNEAVNSYFRITAAEKKDYYLELAVAEKTTEKLELALNGKIITLQPTFTLRGQTVYRRLVEAEDFREGRNFLKIKANPALSLVNARLNPVSRDISHNKPGLADGLLLTPVTSEKIIELDLKQKTLLEEVAVYTDNDHPSFYLSALVDGSWLPLNQKATSGRSLRYHGNFSTEKIRIENPGCFNIAEVKVQGGVITDQAPGVEILSPLDGEVIDLFRLGHKYIYGFVDNQAATVYVNGRQADQNGHYFWLKLTRAGMRPWQTMAITAKATDQNGRENTHAIEVMLGELPLLTLDQADQILYTAEETLTLSGRVKLPSCEVRVNGQLIPVSRWRRFNTELTLEKGFNLIEIKGELAAGKGRKFTQTVYRMVYHQPGQAEITINSPLAGSYLSRDSVLVSGTVSGLGDVTVNVNGKPAEMDGMYFISTPLALTEESNTITVQVNDHNGTVRKTILVYRDLTAPVISAVLPEESALLTGRSVEVEGRVAENGPYYVYVNGKAARITDQVFRRQITLADGKAVAITIEAVDQAGNTAKYTRTVMVDTTPPLSFAVTAEPADWTANRQPVISFNSSDEVSGINHYQVAIGEGDFQQVNSPYQLPTLPDGIHQITVKAIDQAGWETIASTPVYIDTTAPNTFEPVAEPADWTNNTRPVLTFATSDDGCGIDHYQLRINGGEYYPVESPYTLPEQADGIHDLQIKAIDRLGFATVGSTRVYIDTTAPNAFVPVAEPADWTNNTRPVLTFATSDDGCGISHYQISIAGGEYYPVESPYTLPEQTDGIHQIQIKALDKLGHPTVGSTAVYIDTAPPAIPDNFRAIAGAEQAFIKWERTGEEDVVSYRLYRQPQWSEGEYIALAIDSPLLGLEEEHVYIDSAAIFDQEYSYWLAAIDHAGNIGEQTEKSTLQTGITEQPVNPDSEEEIAIEYEDVEIKIPPEAVPESGTIEITLPDEAETPLQKTANTVVSKTVNFEFKDNNGETIEDITFKKPLLVTIEYDEDLIPEGYTPLDLYIYYYSEADGSWIRLKRAGVDLANKQVSTETDHFSMYNVQVKENYSPAAKEYEELGLSPFQSYFQHNQESISPASGSLTVTGTDLTLPGRNGLDLTIGRIYDSSTVTMEKIKKAHKGGALVKGYNSFGVAWNINLPWIKVNDQGTFVHFEDGSANKIDWTQYKSGWSATGRGQVHEGRHFYAEKGQTKRSVILSIFGRDIGGYWDDNWYKVISKDGKEYSFNKAGMVTKIVDRTGQNKITFSYSGRKINYIEDSIGRRVNFVYSGDKISRITVGDRSYQYRYDGDQLIEVIDPAGRKTEFKYTSLRALSGDRGADIPLIEQITYPTGGISKYEYKLHGVTYHGTISGNRTYYVPDEDGEYVDEYGKRYSKKSRSYSYDWNVHDKTTIAVARHYQALSPTAPEKISREEYSYNFNKSDQARIELKRTNQLDKQKPFRITKTTVTETAQKAIIDLNEDNQISRKMIRDL